MKRVGSLDVAQWLYSEDGKPVYCACGCRLRTDRVVKWCSNPRCEYYEMLQTGKSGSNKNENTASVVVERKRTLVRPTAHRTVRTLKRK